MKENTVSLDSAIHLARAVRWLSTEERVLQALKHDESQGTWLRVEATALSYIPAELQELIESFSGINHPVIEEAKRLMAHSKELGMDMLTHSKDEQRPQELQEKAIRDLMTGIEVLFGKLE